MLMGHYATALIAYENIESKNNIKAPFWLLLIGSQFIDFIMLILVKFNIESFTPLNFLDISFANIKTDMFITHDIYPVVGWTILFGLISFIITRDKLITYWCMGLVVVHEVFDLIVGFEHNLFGKASASVGLNLYNNAPVTSLIIESVICFTIVWWFVKRREKRGLKVSKKMKWGLYLILVGGTISTLPLGNNTLRDLIALVSG